ncbi:hypothetical protein SLS58_006546 [Diplodia intermedia]|uniref:Nucleoside phosphorylase domain-containing protein n=1 Tax=Diplodia intermedia TaxID=856260 RepID=A0ABR3TNG1_9PEZI
MVLLDERHEKPSRWTQPINDQNKYSWGRIQNHNMVLACLPKGVYGTTNAATVAATMLSSFTSIRIGLTREIRLGDVVIGRPGDDGGGGVVQYDRGKATADAKFGRTGVLDKPPMVLLTAMSDLESKQMRGELRIPAMIAGVSEDMKVRWGFRYQSAHSDPLLQASDEQQDRSTLPVLWFGTIASGNAVVKSARKTAEIVRLAGKDTVCIEMEAAGLMDGFPCLVVRGICDYADAGKNDKWQNYAALTAAAAAKELLWDMDADEVRSTKKATDTIAKNSSGGSNEHLRERLEKVEMQLDELRQRVKDLGKRKK